MRFVMIQGRSIAVYEDRKQLAVFYSPEGADYHEDQLVIEQLRVEGKVTQ